MGNNKQRRRDDHQSNTPSRNIYNFTSNKGNQPYAINLYTLSKFIFDFSFETHDMKSNHIALLFWVLNVANRSGWKRVLSIPNDWTMEATGIGNKNTLKKCYEDLVNWKFIKWVEKSRNQYTANRIEICRTKSEPAQTQALTQALYQHCTSIENSNVPAMTPYINNINIETIRLSNQQTIKMELYFNKKDFDNYEDIKASQQNLIKKNLEKILKDHLELLSKEDLSENEYEIQLEQKEAENLPAESQTTTDLETQVLDYFGITELDNYRLFTQVRHFLNYLGNQTSIFERNFFYYKKYKEMTGEYIHNLEKFIGTQEKNYEDGVWRSVNYRKKLEQFEKNEQKKFNSNPQAKASEDLNSGKMDVLNRFFNENKENHEEEQ